MKLHKIQEAYRHVDFEKNVEDGDKVKHETLDKKAVTRYTRDSYEYNDILHRHKTGIKGPRPEFHKYDIINGLQAEIHANPKHETNIHVFSGTNFDVFYMYLRHHVQIGKPLRFTVKAFTSTSTDLKIASSYAKSFMSGTELVHDHEVIKNIVDETTSVRYSHVLCFELGGKKALKVDTEAGGYFGDKEKEFILPHSIDVEISGMPTFDKTHMVLVWDAKILTDFDKATAEPIEFIPEEHNIDENGIFDAIQRISRDKAFDDSELNDNFYHLKDAIRSMTHTAFTKHGQEGKIVTKYINLIFNHIRNKTDMIEHLKPNLKIVIEKLGFTKDYLLHGIEPGMSISNLTKVYDQIMG